MSEQALAGLRVLDLTHYIAGPYCTKLLSGLGADVIKVEKPGEGDGARRIGPFFKDEPHPEKSGLFLYLNTSKKGVTLNLKMNMGVKIFKELVKEVDVVVENFEPRVMPGLGIDYEALTKVNPGLVMTSISNFGQTGPYRNYKAADIVAYAMGGMMYVNGVYDREPLKHGLSQAQYLAGQSAAVATLGAFYGQQVAGVGQHVDVSVMESVMVGLFNSLAMYSYSGMIGKRLSSNEGDIDGIMPAKDGYIAPALHTARDWETFPVFMGMPELAKFLSYNYRLQHLPELNALVLPKFKERSKHEIFHSAREQRLPFGLVQTPEDLINCPHLRERNFYVEIEHPATGRLTYPGAPFKMTETPWQVGTRAPLLGEHNEEVFCGRLGYAKEDLVKLRENEVI